MSQGPKNEVPRSKGVPCSPFADRQTDAKKDMKVNTDDTLSGFHEFFLPFVIKDRSNITPYA